MGVLWKWMCKIEKVGFFLQNRQKICMNWYGCSKTQTNKNHAKHNHSPHRFKQALATNSNRNNKIHIDSKCKTQQLKPKQNASTNLNSMVPPLSPIQTSSSHRNWFKNPPLIQQPTPIQPTSETQPSIQLQYWNWNLANTPLKSNRFKPPL